MKKLILALCIAGCLKAGAQSRSIIPEAVLRPVTGFSKLRVDNRYILTEHSNDQGGTWTPVSRYTSRASSVPGILATNIEARWEESTWNDLNIESDSLLLDAQGRISVAIEDIASNYPGFEYRAKYRYTFTYNQAGKPSFIKVQEAQPATSNLYRDLNTYTIAYNNEGYRIADTLKYATGYNLYQYTLDASGNVTATTGIRIASGSTDTTYRAWYSYTGNLLRTIYSESYDFENSVWMPNQRDTFDYNAEGRVSRFVTSSLFSMDGEIFQLIPYLDESYHYTNTGEVDEIVALTANFNTGIFSNASKTTILYNNNKASIGYVYDGEGAGWSTIASSRHIFSPSTGINERPQELLTSVYPVPASDKLYFGLNKVRANEQLVISLCDLNGKEVMHVEAAASGKEQSLDVSGLNAGIYFLNIAGGSAVSKRKIIITH